MATSVERGRATRQRLLDAAVPLLGEVGWTKVTTRLVAERAGVNPGLVHYHFASVTDLLVAASTAFARTVLARTVEQLTAHTDVSEGVDWLLDELAGWSGADPASLAVAEAFLASNRLPDLRAELAALIADFRTDVAGWLRRHGAGDAAMEAATVLAAAIDGLMLHHALDPTLDARALAVPLRRMLLPGGHGSAGDPGATPA